MTAFHYFLVALEVVLVFNLLIGVHELGHFLAAKWRGLKIDRFAIWFGKPVWKARIGGIEYALGWIPAGGYVALPQMASMEAIEGKSGAKAEALPPVSALDKIIVAFAGPLFSFGLAVCFAFIVWGVGKPGDASNRSTEIGWVFPGGPAWKAGLRPGDVIRKVNGHPVSYFEPPPLDSVKWRIITSEGTNIPIQYTSVRDGRLHTAYPIAYHAPTKPWERKALRQILVAPAAKAIVGDVASNSPAALAGLTNGDRIIALDGEKIYSPLAVGAAEESMSNGPVRPIALTVVRDHREFVRSITPERPVEPAGNPPSMGIRDWMGDTNMLLSHPTPQEQIWTSLHQITATLRAITAPKSDIGVQQLGGAVMIARVYYYLLQSDYAWRQVLWFSVVLNVNLALINMLPLPVLDGGHILLSLIEAVRRRPMSAKLLNTIQTGFAMLIIGFMLYIAFFDTGDWLRSASANREQPLVFAPPRS
ncbi:MAG: RIP metalloprotease RseP [Verrucomicrobia bacterium]|nr:RIP metalloprotease RseP [Verrucomicrobiota bacterium]MDE3099104.1 RIP metalloprotease RseP [Verrucomicrobiota bacterium]